MVREDISMNHTLNVYEMYGLESLNLDTSVMCDTIQMSVT